MSGEEDFPNSEVVPPGLPGIQAFLRVAKYFRHTHPRIAYLCVWGALEESCRINTYARGEGVRVFNYRLWYWMKSKDGQGELLPSDASYLQSFYLQYYQENIQISQSVDFVENIDSFNKLKRACINARGLYKVLEFVLKDTQPPSEILEANSEVNRLSEIYKPYNTQPNFPIKSRLKKA